MDDDRPSPAPVWLCAGFLTVGGLICVGLAAWLVLTGVGWIPVGRRAEVVPDELWICAAAMGGAGLLQLVLAGWGVWRGQPPAEAD
mgnify:CR=1 FL=1